MRVNPPTPEPPAPTTSATTATWIDRVDALADRVEADERRFGRDCLIPVKASELTLLVGMLRLFHQKFVPPASAPAATAEPETASQLARRLYEALQRDALSGDFGNALSERVELAHKLAGMLESRPAAPSGEEAETFDLAAQLNAFYNATHDGDEERGEEAQNAIVDEFARLTAQATELAALRARVEGYRNMLAAKLGYTLIPQDTTVRPDAASFVKPSEFDAMTLPANTCASELVR